jgi:hypothetical protein
MAKKKKPSPEEVFTRINVGTDMYLHALVESRLLIQASSGAGKSYMLRVLAEQVIRHMPVIILDWEGEFATLRERHDLVLAGPSGEVPCNMKTAAMLARNLIELEVSAIVDMSELKMHQRQEYAATFLKALIELPKKLWPSKQGKAVMILVDEAHKLCPQKEKSESSSAVIDLQSLGRKRGLCGVLATQRLSKLNKDAAAECNNIMIGRCSGIDAPKACEMLGLLPSNKTKLTQAATGMWWGVGPAFPFVDLGLLEWGCTTFRGGTAATTHDKSGTASLTPPKPSAKIKKVIPQLEAAQVKTAQEIKDLGEAKKEIANLKRQVTLAKKENPEPKPEVVTEVVTEIDYDAVARAVEARDQQWRPLLAEARTRLDVAANLQQRIRGEASMPLPMVKDLADPAGFAYKSGPKKPKADPNRVKSNGRRTGRKEKPKPTEFVNRVPSGEEPDRSEMKILGALAWYGSVGIDQPDRAIVGIMAGYKGGGRFNNLLGGLRRKGHIDYPGDGSIEITDSGRSHAPVIEVPLTLQDLWDAWQAKLSKSQWKLVEVVLDETLVDADLTPAQLAEQSGYTVGGRFNNLLGSLRSLGLITKRGPIAPTPLLYPEGLE